MKKLTKTNRWLAGLLAATVLLGATPTPLKADEGESQLFLVTAYYSPKPGQSVYIRGSLEADIRLNGRGTNGADGTEVFDGILAAPKTYAFGTRIHLPGLGVGAVHDRGGAIVEREKYHRIDVWMGEGDEGLARALNWGSRLMEGVIYRNAKTMPVTLSYTHISSAMPRSLLSKRMQNPEVFKKDITPTSNEADIRELQEALFSLGYFDNSISGVYDAVTKEAVILFQITEGVVTNRQSAGAGNFGPLTRKTLKYRLAAYNTTLEKEIKRLEQNKAILAAGLGRDAQGDDVYHLQQMLWELGYYSGELNGVYDAATIDAVFEFQKTHGILQSNYDKGAGYFGQKTHQVLQAAITKRIEKMSEMPQEKQVWIPAQVALPTVAALTPVSAHESRQLLFAPDIMNKKIYLPPQFLNNLNPGDSGIEVQKLQRRLIELGLLASGLDTGTYGAKTQAAVLDFQIKQGIVKTPADTGAGRVGPKTREAL